MRFPNVIRLSLSFSFSNSSSVVRRCSRGSCITVVTSTLLPEGLGSTLARVSTFPVFVNVCGVALLLILLFFSFLQLLFEFSECAHTYRELLNPILWFSWARGGDRSSCSSSISPRRHRLLSSFVVRAWMKVVAAVKYISRVSWLAKQIWNAYMRFLV